MSSEKIVRLIKYLTYSLVVLIPLIYFPTGMFPFQIIKTVVFQILTEIIFVLWLVLAIFNRNYRPKFTPVFIALIIFTAIISLSVVFGSDWRAGLWSDEQRTLGLVSVLHFAALFLVLSSIGQYLNNFWRTLWLLSLGTAIVVSLIGISQKFFTFSQEPNIWLKILYSYSPFKPVIPAERVGSTFGNPTFMAGYLLFNFFIGLWLFASRKTLINTDNKLIYADKRVGLRRISMNYRSVFLITGMLLILIAIFLSQTLGVILGLGVGIFILLLAFSFQKQSILVRRISLILLLFSIIFAASFWLTRENVFWQKIPGLSRISQVSFASASVRDRLITWQISLKAFREKPLLGWGFENFRIPFNKYYDPRILTQSMSGTYWDKPHNILLEYLTNAGILGILSYLGIFAAAFYSLRKARIYTDNNQSTFMAVMLISYFVQNVFIFDTLGTYLMFFLVLAFVDISSSHQYKSAEISINQRFKNQHQSAREKSLRGQQFITISLLILTLVPIYYNFQIFNASHYEYWGVNYFLNMLTESSLLSFNRSLKTPTPYIDDIRKNFATTVQQGFQQGIEYPALEKTQAKAVEELKLVIKRHPKDFFNYITLAEFMNVFYSYNPNYLDEAEELSQKALELSPKRQQTYYVLAKTKLLKNDIGAVYKIFEKAVNLNPDAGDPHFYYGLMAYGSGDYQKGAAEIAEAERLGRFPQGFKEAVALGNFVGDYEHNYKKSIELYKLALSTTPDEISRSNVLLKLAVAYYFDGNQEQSRQTFLELKNLIDFKKLPIYPELQPILKELKIDH